MANITAEEHLQGWTIVKDTYEPEEELNIETLFAMSNGYMGLRASLELPSFNKNAQTFLAGVYDKPDRIDVSGKFGLTIRNKALAPSYAIAPVANQMEIAVHGDAIDFMNCKIVSFNRTLDMKRGALRGEYRLEDAKGRITMLKTVTIASKADVHLAAVYAEVTPVNYSGQVTVNFICRQSTDPQYIPRLMDYTSKTDIMEAGAKGDAVFIRSKISETGVEIAMCAQTVSEVEKSVNRGEKGMVEAFNYDAERGKTVTFAKFITIYTGCECDDPFARAHKALVATVARGAEKVFAAHYDLYADKWAVSDLEITGDSEAQTGTRWSLFSMLQLGMEEDSDVSISPTGLHGQGYFGHIFWDSEIYMLPFYLAVNPAIAERLVLYRYNRLDAARELAREQGHDGARFPWTSTWKGYDVTPHDWERVAIRAIHLSADIAYAFENCLAWTGDREFYTNYGVEVIVETAKYYASKATKGADCKYHYLDVIGPDEYNLHSDDNYYTNYIIKWNILRAIEIMDDLKEHDTSAFGRIAHKTAWSDARKAFLKEVAHNINFPQIRDNVVEQHDGFFKLKDIGGIERDEYGMPAVKKQAYDTQAQIIKQPDAVMMHYLFPDGFDSEVQKATFEYYEQRCNLGSSLGPAIHCIVGNRVGFDSMAYRYYLLSALLDVKNLHLDKSLDSGVHIACTGGTWAAAVYGFGGVELTKGTLSINPKLPAEWQGLRFRFLYHGIRFDINIAKGHYTVAHNGKDGFTAVIGGKIETLSPGKAYTFEISR